MGEQLVDALPMAAEDEASKSAEPHNSSGACRNAESLCALRREFPIEKPEKRKVSSRLRRSLLYPGPI